MDEAQPGQTQPTKHRVSFNVDLRWVVIVLLLAIAGLIAAWQPWKSSTPAGSRTIKVSGEATVKAEPDRFIFSPTYTITNSDREAALDAMAERTAELTAGLKTIGIKDSQIKSNIDSYSRGIMPEPEKPGGATSSYSLQLTVTVDERSQAQKVQDYLATTAPTGVITPYASFSDSKRKQLESQARDLATKDARTKADQSAANLGFKVGEVKSVADGNGFDNGCGPGGICLAEDRAIAPSGSGHINVQPGENELRYTVSVEYFVE